MVRTAVTNMGFVCMKGKHLRPLCLGGGEEEQMEIVYSVTVFFPHHTQ